MSFLRTFLMFVFVVALVGVSGSYAGKISNCSNCKILTKISDTSFCEQTTQVNVKTGIIEWKRYPRVNETTKKGYGDESYSKSEVIQNSIKRKINCGVGKNYKDLIISMGENNPLKNILFGPDISSQDPEGLTSEHINEWFKT